MKRILKFMQMMQQFIISSKNKNIVRFKLQSGTCGFQIWCLCNNIFIHIQKSSIMWIGSWQNLQFLDSLDFYLDYEIIQQVDHKSIWG